jgi:hypothetical protein
MRRLQQDMGNSGEYGYGYGNSMASYGYGYGYGDMGTYGSYSAVMPEANSMVRSLDTCMHFGQIYNKRVIRARADPHLGRNFIRVSEYHKYTI